MGGFMLYDGKTPLHSLTPENINTLVGDGYIDFPDITEKEIRDKSKGDVLSKCLFILQTGWFIVQCIARAIEHLPVTELELGTVAFATLNFVTYVFWWSKPLNVQRPYRVLLKKPMFDRQHGPREREMNIVRWAAWMVEVIFGEKDEVDLTAENRVPTFYAGHLEDRQGNLSAFGAAVVAMIFGAIHCIAWSFTFPTLAERLLWRVSSIAIIGVPFYYVVFFWLLGLVNDSNIAVPTTMAVIPYTILVLALPLYVVARLVLLVQAFMTLRSLPSEAFQLVHWTTFIPHL